MAAAAAPSRPPAFVQVSRPWNTLRILRTSLFALTALDLLLLLAAFAGARVHRSAMQTIGRDSAPSIIDAQRIKTALADMDAEAANDLLSTGAAGSTLARRQYDQRRNEAAQALIDAAQNITYGREERDPIERIQLQLGTYEARVQRARDLHDDKNSAAVAAYEEAANLLDNVLLPAADDLDSANNRHLEAAYANAGSYLLATRIFLLFTGLAFLGALLWMQSFLGNRTRRILNLPLFAATLVALGFTLWALTVLGIEERDLKIARQDAFISIHALWRARAVAYTANGDESRFLLDPANASRAADDFTRKVNLLMNLPPGVTLEHLAWYYEKPGEAPAFTGYFADELNNITFPGERDAAGDTILKFGEYLKVDKRIREFERSGKHDEAIALCTGTHPGQSDYAFAQFDDALGRTISINRRAFDNAVEGGFYALSNFEGKAAAAAALMALLIVAGLMQRIAEYR